MRICVNYVFEYFNNYLNITEAEEKTVLQNEKLEKYSKQLQEYEPEVRDWLVKIYAEHGKHLNKSIGSILKQDEFFLIYNTDKEFRSISYDCYSQLIKKHPFLKDQTELLFLFIKDYHRIQSQRSWLFNIPFISEGINNWIEDTWSKHQVNVAAFADNWVNYFYDHEDLWPATHRKKSQYTWRKYDYDIKQKSNLFNLNSLYRKMPKKSFTKGRKQELEVLMMYFWLNSLEGDNEGYWQEYLEKVLPVLNKELG
ncbi:MAG: hypothetical protein ACOYVK_03330 [Bacillota bacterium]|jgi:hypothetical protein|uniref:hypothetical protein n=1 Tax=Desulfitibacter alkalitolerans TaxID=264641 RepID=UPI000AA96018|nr:hypothetical protein [Desulfitibacter alkalitolerans]